MGKLVTLISLILIFVISVSTFFLSDDFYVENVHGKVEFKESDVCNGNTRYVLVIDDTTKVVDINTWRKSSVGENVDIKVYTRNPWLGIYVLISLFSLLLIAVFLIAA